MSLLRRYLDYRDIRSVLLAQRELVSSKIQLYGVSERGDLANEYSGSGSKAHVEKAPPERARSAYRGYAPVFACPKLVKLHSDPPSEYKQKAFIQKNMLSTVNILILTTVFVKRYMLLSYRE